MLDVENKTSKIGLNVQRSRVAILHAISVVNWTFNRLIWTNKAIQDDSIGCRRISIHAILK